MTGDREPGIGAPRAHVAWQLREQARVCATSESPFYAALLHRSAADVEAGGPAWPLLREHVLPGRGRALALRLMAAVHRLVLEGEAQSLVARYPSVGGDGDAEAAWPAFAALLEERGTRLAPLIARPCQTNEVGRAAALIFGVLHVAALWKRPIRLLEIGASAGLNLRLDAFHYGGGGGSWGPSESPVDLRGLWRETPHRMEAAVEIVERRGCDPAPLDPQDPDDQLSLRSSVWADQVARFARLDGALRLATVVPARVDKGSVDAWLGERLEEPALGGVDFVYHSVVDEYLDESTRQSFRATLQRASERASAARPLAWVRLEPYTSQREHGLHVTTWPGGETSLLALAGPHGGDVRRPR